MTTTNELRGKITEYGNFISQTLQPQLQTAVDAKEGTEAEISEYVQLQNKLRDVETAIISIGGNSSSSSSSKKESDASINTIVDIAHATIYCNATIPNPRIVYVNVGFGFHVEMTLREAISYIDKRVEHLEKNVLRHHSKTAATIAGDVEDALELLEEMGEALAGMKGSLKR
ncbi:hypothetical protein ACHAXR_008112 [Thalassiosira sp. AJA248-18]